MAGLGLQACSLLTLALRSSFASCMFYGEKAVHRIRNKPISSILAILFARWIFKNICYLLAPEPNDDFYHQEHQIAELRYQNAQLQMEIEQHTTPLYKLRRRILLDQARTKIAAAWAPRGQWSEISHMTPRDIRDVIVSERVFRQQLGDQEITMICEGKVRVRLEGNKVAHEAEESMLRDAILLGEQGPDVEVLKNIFKCYFDRNSI